MKILFIAAEATPLAKVGGLADVVGSLPTALIELGHDVRLMIPQYGTIDLSPYSVSHLEDNFGVRSMGKVESAGLNITTIKHKVPVYMVENKTYFGRDDVYSRNDLERFLFFSRAVFEILPQLDWQPEVVHCHDWHTALAVMLVKKRPNPPAMIFTIHNLAYQGVFDKSFLAESGLENDWRDYPSDAPKPPPNLMSQGILWADLVTTVSETYAKQIVTPEYGEGLDSLLRYRQKDLLGIVNGLDYEEFNPEIDPYLQVNYNSTSIERRTLNKLALQKRANLPQDADIPLIGMVQRLDEQKGFDILEKAADHLLTETRAQFFILGKGRERYENVLKRIAAKYPEQVAAFITFDNPLAHLIYAGCDLFLMPSRFEPCGLGQLIAMRYGALPLVRHTGGLADTVLELTPDLEDGSGFIFRDYTSEALIAVVRQGIEAFKNKVAWHQAMRRVMKRDFSWRASAVKYERAYRQISSMLKS